MSIRSFDGFHSFQRQIIMDARAQRVPVNIAFELTSRCNLRCRMCYVCGRVDASNLKERELATAQWLDIARQAKDAGALFLLLTGGEVLLREDFPVLYTELSKMGFLISIYTNGTLLTPALVALFKQIRPFELTITLYGASRETYQAVTGLALAHDQVMQGITWLHEAGVPFSLKVTLIKLNRNDLPALHAFVTGLGLPFSWVEYIEPRREGEGTTPLDVRLSPEERLTAEQELMRLDEGYREEWRGVRYSGLDDYEVFPCNAGRTGYWVAWDGRMLPCASMREPAPDLCHMSVVDAWERVKAGVDAIPGCADCEQCADRNVCNACPAVLKLETGSYEAPASYLCEYARRKNSMND